MLCSARCKLRMKLCPILTHAQRTTGSSGLARPARDSTTTLPGGEEWTMTLQQVDIDESHLRPAAPRVLHRHPHHRPATRTAVRPHLRHRRKSPVRGHRQTCPRDIHPQLSAALAFSSS